MLGVRREMDRRYIVLQIGVIIIANIVKYSTPCDIPKAEECAAAQQKRLDQQLNVHRKLKAVTTETRQLCLSTLKEDNITQCYYDNTVACDALNKKFLTYIWEENMNDTKKFCNNVCTNYENLTVCEQQIKYHAVNQSQWNAFCLSYNSSISCAKSIVSSCQLDLPFFANLIKPQAIQDYNTFCLTGCNNLDETMSVIQNCWSSYRVGLTEGATQCSYHRDFKACLYLPDAVCPEVETLVTSLYYPYAKVDDYCRRQTVPTTTMTTEPKVQTTTMTTESKVQTTAMSTELEVQTTSTEPESTTVQTTVTETQQSTDKLTTVKEIIPFTDSMATAMKTETTVSAKIITTRTTEQSKEARKDLPDQEVSYLECFGNHTGNLTEYIDTVIDAPFCSGLFEDLSCVFNKSSTANQVQVLTYLKPILSSSVFTQCSLIIKHQNVETIRLANSSCVKGQVQDQEDYDYPLCNGHTYGLIKCRNGAERATRLYVVQIVLFITIFIHAYK